MATPKPRTGVKASTSKAPKKLPGPAPTFGQIRNRGAAGNDRRHFSGLRATEAAVAVSARNRDIMTPQNSFHGPRRSAAGGLAKSDRGRVNQPSAAYKTTQIRRSRDVFETNPAMPGGRERLTPPAVKAPRQNRTPGPGMPRPDKAGSLYPIAKTGPKAKPASVRGR